MKRVIRAESDIDNLKDVLKQLVSELEDKAQEFCNEHGLSADMWGQVNDFDKEYDETVDVNFSVTVELPEEEE